jgi:hypothetical protein
MQTIENQPCKDIFSNIYLIILDFFKYNFDFAYFFGKGRVFGGFLLFLGKTHSLFIDFFCVFPYNFIILKQKK